MGVSAPGLLDESEVAELAALMQGGRALSEKELLGAMVRFPSACVLC